MRNKLALLLAFLLLVPMVLWAGGRSGALKGFSALELLDIDNSRNEKGQKLPDEMIPELRHEVLHSIVSLHIFHRVEDRLDDVAPGAGPERTILLKVKITGYTGAQNQAGVKADLSFIDKESGQEIFRTPVNAQLYFDQGATSSASRKLAHVIADVVRDSR